MRRYIVSLLALLSLVPSGVGAFTLNQSDYADLLPSLDYPGMQKLQDTYDSFYQSNVSPIDALITEKDAVLKQINDDDQQVKDSVYHEIGEAYGIPYPCSTPDAACLNMGSEYNRKSRLVRIDERRKEWMEKYSESYYEKRQEALRMVTEGTRNAIKKYIEEKKAVQPQPTVIQQPVVDVKPVAPEVKPIEVTILRVGMEEPKKVVKELPKYFVGQPKTKKDLLSCNTVVSKYSKKTYLKGKNDKVIASMAPKWAICK